MDLELGGLHHVTAVTARAAANVAFYTRTLGLRLVKKTVNQDDLSAYHLFYADADGNAGTEVTFFDWAHTAPNRPGTSEVAAVGLRVPSRDSVAWWAARFDELGVPHEAVGERRGRAVLRFADPEGQRLELADDGGAPGGVPWDRSPVPPEHQIRGLDAADLTVRRLEPTARLLTAVMGMRLIGEDPAGDGADRPVSVFAMGSGGPGRELRVAVRPDLPPARLGRGGVHHIAFRTPDDATHAAWQARLAAAGVAVTPVIDRYYFRSLYFREPGGVLFEIATDGPGFATDEDPAHLGERLALPPFLEPRRAEIEAGLQPLETAAGR